MGAGFLVVEHMSQHKLIPNWLRRLLTSPTSELTRWERAAKFVVDLARHCARELYRDNALEMAASLAFRTLFSMIPILVLSLLFARAFIGMEKIEQQAEQWALQFMGLTTIPMAPYEERDSPPMGEPEGEAEPAAGASPRSAAADRVDASAPSEGGGVSAGAAGEGGADAQATQTVEKEGTPQITPHEKQLRETVANKIAQMVRNVAELNFAGVGAIGLGVLVYAAIALVQTMESSFNIIYGAVAGRSYTRQLLLYWTVLTLGPILLLITFYVGNQIVATAEQITFLGSLVGFLGRFTSFAASWLLLLALYALLPYTSVQFRPALIGSLIGAGLWEAARWGFALYVSKFVPYSVLYGSLGLIPLFMWWVYLTWLIVLFGLELTYTLQAMKGRSFKSEEAAKKKEDLIIDPSWMIPLAARIATGFRRGQLSDVDTLSQALNLPQPAVTKLVHALRDFHIIHRVETESQIGYSLTRPADEISVHRLLDATWSLLPRQQNVAQADPAWRLVREMHRRERETADERTLADLVKSIAEETADRQDEDAHRPHEMYMQ